MKVKKYHAPSMAEAMKKVRVELGDNAVILNSKVIHKGGFLGLFKKKNIEVIAAIDPEAKVGKPEPKEFKKELQNIEIPKITQNVVPTESGQTKETSEKVEKELSELKQMIQTLSSKSPYAHFSLEIQEILLYLQNHDVNVALLNRLGKFLEGKTEQNSQSNELNKELFIKWSKYFIRNEIKEFPHGGIQYNKKYVNVIGPTGVGKTTTLAKMAAEAVIENRKKIGFITTDTYRIAAIEQLKTYAQLLSVPVEVVYKISDFEKAKEKFADYDLVFIDTAGRNFREAKYVHDLNEIINFNEEMESFLVLSLTSKERDLQSIIAQFSTITIDRFIFTKLDETSSYGTMFNLMTEYKTGAAYVTTGQSVPEDIKEVDSEMLTNLLFEGLEP